MPLPGTRVWVTILVLGAMQAGLCGCGLLLRKRAARAAAGARAPDSATEVLPRLGIIESVRSGGRFVMINLGTAPLPAPGTRLQFFHEAAPAGELLVGGHQKRPFVIADIVSGEPQVGDAVTVFFPAHDAPSSVPAGEFQDPPPALPELPAPGTEGLR